MGCAVLECVVAVLPLWCCTSLGVKHDGGSGDACACTSGVGTGELDGRDVAMGGSALAVGLRNLSCRGDRAAAADLLLCRRIRLLADMLCVGELLQEVVAAMPAVTAVTVGEDVAAGDAEALVDGVRDRDADELGCRCHFDDLVAERCAAGVSRVKDGSGCPAHTGTDVCRPGLA